MNTGFIYVVDGKRWAREASYAIKQLRRVSVLPICVISSENFRDIEILQNENDNVIVKIISEIKNSNFCSKVLGMMESPFKNNLYMDTDTFVVQNIDHVFNLLDLCDIAMKIEPNISTGLYGVSDKYDGIFSEFNTGVILYKKNTQVLQLFGEWSNAIIYKSYSQDYFDMPQLRNVLIKTKIEVKILPFSEVYNMSGLRTYKIIHGKVFIIHERFGNYWNSFSEKMLNNKKMEKISKQINKTESKRIFIPFFNIVVPTRIISIDFIIRMLKKKLGFKKIKKNQAI
jgi:hypothetical protein